METSTRERLTGALLVLLAVVVVAPEIFSGRRTAGQGTPPAQNPEEGAPLQTFNVQLDAASAPETPRDVPPAAAAAIAAVPPPVTEAAPPADLSAVSLAVPVEKAPAGGDVPSAERERKPSREDAATRPAAPAAAAAGKWWVQVGRFESGENAQRLAKKLRAAGYTIDVSRSRAKGKDLYQVRAGPVADRAAASELMARLVAAGEKNPFLVAP